MRCISHSLLATYVNNNDDNSNTLICLWMVNVEGEFRIGRRVMATRRDCYMNATVGQSISLGCVRERWVSFPTSWERCSGPRNCPLPGSQYNQYSTNNPLSCARLIIALRTTLSFIMSAWSAVLSGSSSHYIRLRVTTTLSSLCLLSVQLTSRETWEWYANRNRIIAIICFIDHCYHNYIAASLLVWLATFHMELWAITVHGVFAYI